MRTKRVIVGYSEPYEVDLSFRMAKGGARGKYVLVSLGWIDRKELLYRDSWVRDIIYEEKKIPTI